MSHIYTCKDIMLALMVLLAKLDLGETLMKLYITAPVFREFLSSEYNIGYLKSVLGISLEHVSFPLVCVHLSIRDPSTSRVPYNVCLLLAIRHNYPIILTNEIPPSLLLVNECCDRILACKNKNISIHAHTALKVLGPVRTSAILYGVYTTYETCIYRCIARGRHDMGVCSSHTISIHQTTEALLEVCIDIFLHDSEEAIYTLILYNSQHPILLKLMHCIIRLDMIDLLKRCVIDNIVSIQTVFNEFDSLTSTKIFTWLFDEHGYSDIDIRSQYYPYSGSVLSSLRRLYDCNDIKVSYNIVHAVICSDDVNALLWLRDRGNLSRAYISYYKSSGITLEILKSIKPSVYDVIYEVNKVVI